MDSYEWYHKGRFYTDGYYYSWSYLWDLLELINGDELSNHLFFMDYAH